MVAIYSWIILGVFGAQYLDIQHNASVIFFSLPWFQVTFTMLNYYEDQTLQIVKIILIWAWMKVANIVRNPFGLDDNYI